MFAGHETQLLAAQRGMLGGHPALDALVRGVGGGGAGHYSVVLWLDGRRVTASVVRKNRAAWLEFSASFEDRAPPLMDDALIELRTETRADESHKRQQLVREVQLGIPSFDRRVFVDNRCTDDEARRLLSDADVRAAVMLMLSAGHGPINLSARQVWVAFRAGEVGDELEVEHLVMNLATIASAGPPATVEKVRRGEGLVLGLGLMSVALTCVFLAIASMCNGVPGPFIGVGLLAGALTALGAWWPMRELVSGDSGSGGRRRWVVGLSAWVVMVTLTGALTAINVGFDDSPARHLKGHVEELRPGSKNRVTPIVRWADGTESPRRFGEPVAVGTRCSEDRRDGALGAEWHENLRIEWR